MIFTAIASEDIKNHTICVYSNLNNTVRNFNEDFQDALMNCCVYIDMCEPNGKIVTDIKKGTMVRCRLVKILM